MTVMLVNITGPDAKQVEAGQPVPSGWDAEYVKSLVKEGAAGSQKAWDDIVERNRIESEARAGEPRVPVWSESEQAAYQQYEALKAQLDAVASLGVDVSGVELPEAPPPPPQVAEKILEASRAVLEAPAAASAATAAKRLATVVKKAAPAVPVDPAIAKVRHELAGRIVTGGDK